MSSENEKVKKLNQKAFTVFHSGMRKGHGKKTVKSTWVYTEVYRCYD